MTARPGSPLPHATSLRLSAPQYAHLVLVAGMRGLTLGEAIRRAIERDIDATAALEQDGGDPIRWRTFVSLPGLDLSEAVEQLQERERGAA